MGMEKYALLWEDAERGVLIGTPIEIVKGYLGATGKALKVEMETLLDADEEEIEGDWDIYIRYPGEEEWELFDYLPEDHGSPEANLEAGYLAYFHDALYFNGEWGCDGRVFALETPAQEEAFTLEYDALLDRITAREVRDEGLDLDEEPLIREWFFDNKTA